MTFGNFKIQDTRYKKVLINFVNLKFGHWNLIGNCYLEIGDSVLSRPACRNGMTGAAWLSSARVVRCSVKSVNERNPHFVLYFSQRTALVNREEGGDDVKSAWPLRLGLHTCYNGRYNGLQTREGELIPSKPV